MNLQLEFEVPVTTLAVAGSDRRFPVRRIYCVGRNYLEHIREMGGDEREEPFFFQKPTDAIVASGSTVSYPGWTHDFQFEIELVLAIGRGGSRISQDVAHEHVFAIAAGIDLTRRDVQVQARKAGRPWEVGKSFDHSAPCGALIPLGGAPLPSRGSIRLAVNGETRQEADLSQMIWSSAEIIAKLSEQYHLVPGDLIYTGTPAGVGPVVAGDVLLGEVQQAGSVSITIA